MDDFLRDLQKQQEMIRRLTEGPLRYLRENQTAIERARALMDTKPFNAMRDTLAALDLKASMPELVSAAKFTNNAFSAFALRDSVLEMQRYADTHRETYEVMERAALPYKQIGEQIRAMSRYLDSSHASMAAIDHGRFGELISASEGGASMRKLLKGVLHNVAPNGLVLPWALTNGKPLDSNRKPTRATKVDWLCEFVPNAEYRSIVKTQMMAALSMIGLLDTSQHEDDSPEFEQQYDEIILRSEIAVRHILTIWKARRTH
jgi:hypothetical protein